MKQFRMALIFCLLLFGVNPAPSQDRKSVSKPPTQRSYEIAPNGDLGLRRRLWLTRDDKLEKEYLDYRLAAEGMPLADRVTITGVVSDSNTTGNNDNLKLKFTCDNHVRGVEDADLTFIVDLDDASQEVVWNKLGLHVASLERSEERRVGKECRSRW